MAESANTFELPERLTLAEAEPTLARLADALARHAGPVVTISTEALQVFDSSALAVLLELRRRLVAQGRALKVNGWPPRLKELAALYGIQELLAA
ncbi:STAS domain-containing protein [Hydrogenophaga sp.]|uniref:STAS domain-containing protein n=1 Tax=Hydrogenophaga sp. TaxID=1904254 RepID=UPI003D121489